MRSLVSPTFVRRSLVEQIEAKVQSRLNGRMRDFRLTIQEEGLVLRGRVPTYYVKQLAQEAVMEMTEILIVANDIQVI